MNVTKIVERFLSRLKEDGMTRNRLAKESGVSKTVVYDLADGTRKRVSMKNLEKMQDYMGV